MMDARAQILPEVRTCVEGRPVRWANAPLGDYDGRDRTLEIFNADASDQRKLARRLFAMRHELAKAAGGAVVFVFHTRKHSAELHGDFIEEALRLEVEDDVNAVKLELVGKKELMPDVGVHEGEPCLPRKAA